MRLLLLCDLHGHLPPVAKLPKADLALVGGDLTPLGAVSHLPMEHEQAAWIDGDLRPWAADLAGLMPTVAIAGNHDFAATMPWGDRLLRSLAWTWLRDQGVDIEVAGQMLRVFGSPWSPRHPRYPNWAFQAEDAQLTRHWQKIERACDVLLVHGPPRSSMDLTAHGHAGSASLAQWLDRTEQLTGRRPLTVCGHLHETPGYDSTANVALGSIVHPKEARARSRVLVLEGSPQTGWQARFERVPMRGGPGPLLAGMTREQHGENLRSDRLPSA